MTFLVSVMILVPLLGPVVASNLSAVIETSSGPVRGVIASTLNGVGYAAFLGIRYAEPPVKHLRFKHLKYSSHSFAPGFLSLYHPEATGNQGLKDQRLALEWVQKNIEKFGGDPQSVTIFGKDAGAASVGYHVLSDASKGLFHAAISMSGTPLGLRSFVSQAEAIRRGSKLAALIGSKLSPSAWTKKASLQALCKATPAELVVNTFYVDQNSPFVPTVENPTKSTDVFLSDKPISKYKSGHFNKVPQLLGVMVPHTEQYVFSVTYPEDLACIFYIPSIGYDLSRNSQTGQIIHSVSTMWTNFAKYDDPTPDPFAFDTFGIAWPPSGSSGSGILIGSKFEVVSTPMNVLFDPTTPPYIDLFH